MGLRVGIVGLPNVGKSTLFNALLKKRVALSANYPFATIEPNVGVVAVPDERLERLAELVKGEEKMENLPPLVPAVVEFVDIAGLVKGASTGVGLGNQFLSHIREVDAIIHVLRDFEDTNIIREGSITPQEDKTVIETELALADLQVVEKLIVGQEKEVRGSKDPLEQSKLEILKQIQDDLNELSPHSKEQGFEFLSKDNKGKTNLADKNISDERLKDWFYKLPLLTIKPILNVLNVAEDKYRDSIASLQNDKTIVISAKVEEDLGDLSEEERKEYLKELGIEQTGLERLITKAYDLLGLISFLTAGKKEVKAWTIKKGTKAPQAAGVIHTDFEKKFIRAEVIEYNKLIEIGSRSTAKTKGLLRVEGKDYIMKDGDVVEFLIGS